MYLNSAIIVARWPNTGAVKDNWGDRINPEFIARLSRTPVVHSSHVLGWQDRPVFRVIGSGIASSDPNDVIWGMGFISSDQAVQNFRAQLHAVRGPLTRIKLMEQGISCPPIYGDPVVLCPLLYLPRIEPSYRYGIVQHYREIGTVPLPKIKSDASCQIIDVRAPFQAFINAIMACETIISSSLHGIICAHAYGRRAIWMRPSDLPLGDGFKFRDYFTSIGRANAEPAQIDGEGHLEVDEDRYSPQSSVIDAERLLEACPFISQDRRRDLINYRRKLAKLGSKGTIFI